jgi:hypothetical protein
VFSFHERCWIYWQSFVQPRCQAIFLDRLAIAQARDTVGRKAEPTSQSIIKQHSALHDDALAGNETARDDGLIVLLEADLDGTRLKGPWRDLDEHLIGLVLQHQGRRRHDQHVLFWAQKDGIGEHVQLEPRRRVLERNTDLGPARVRLENVADKENLPLETSLG